MQTILPAFPTVLSLIPISPHIAAVTTYYVVYRDISHLYIPPFPLLHSFILSSLIYSNILPSPLLSPLTHSLLCIIDTAPWNS